MELYNVEHKDCETKYNDDQLYVNTRIITRPAARAIDTQREETEGNENLYEQLRLGNNTNEGSGIQADKKWKNIQWENIPKTIKYTIFISLALIVVLYIVVIVVIVMIVLPVGKVDGNWTQWSAWSSCNVTCDNGTKTRMRYCTKPVPSKGGRDCLGASTDVTHCQNGPCLLQGGWSQWLAWGSCSVSCDVGLQSRIRSCPNPYDRSDSDSCSGESREDRICILVACAHGGWSAWRSWGSCSNTCGGGVRKRSRTCTSPRPSLTGRPCIGDTSDIMTCNRKPCPVAGNWAQWSAWSSCDVTCDNGTKTRTRFCIDPTHSNGAISCSGSSTDTQDCQKEACPVPGNWNQWTSWGSCSVSCDVGMQSRNRSCSNAYSNNVYGYCFGESRDNRLCILKACANGGWSRWGSWGSCSDSCGGGVRSRLRSCTNPRPSLLGRYCDGSSEQMISCNKHTCSDGGWSRWGSWGSCSESCGGGVKSRLRSCTNPRPSLLGRYCDGSPEQVISCNKQTCSDHKVAFTAYGSSRGTSSSVIKFPQTWLNNGGAYSSSTGRFTCKIPGIYNFAVTLTKIRKDIDQISAYLRVNGVDRLTLHSDPDDRDNIDFGSYSLSVTGNFYLKRNDQVYVYGGNSSYFYNDFKTSFAGVLVIPDD